MGSVLMYLYSFEYYFTSYYLVNLLHKCVDDKNSVRNGALLCAAYRERVDIAFSLIIPENARICVLNILRRQL